MTILEIGTPEYTFGTRGTTRAAERDWKIGRSLGTTLQGKGTTGNTGNTNYDYGTLTTASSSLLDAAEGILTKRKATGQRDE